MGQGVHLLRGAPFEGRIPLPSQQLPPLLLLPLLLPLLPVLLHCCCTPQSFQLHACPRW